MDKPLIGIVMGSTSDWDVMQHAARQFKDFGVPFDARALSAHRTPEKVDRLVRDPATDVFIAMAGLSAALPGAVAARTLKPVIGVPLHRGLGLDSLLSVVQMPPGIPVAAVGLDAAENAALLATAILALKYPELEAALVKYRAKWHDEPTPATGGPA
jgi:5-(carboxyamino)imidazole ribonucleotide mutase